MAVGRKSAQVAAIGRSENMRRIRSKDTKPELAVRRVAHAMGFRYRLHRTDLPGKPDLVFPGRRKVVFVHGCFWHQHPDAACTDARLPKSRQEYWLPKLARNSARDRENVSALERLGWHVLTIWECETTDRARLEQLLKEFLNGASGRTRTDTPLGNGF